MVPFYLCMCVWKVTVCVFVCVSVGVPRVRACVYLHAWISLLIWMRLSCTCGRLCKTSQSISISDEIMIEYNLCIIMTSQNTNVSRLSMRVWVNQEEDEIFLLFLFLFPHPPPFPLLFREEAYLQRPEAKEAHTRTWESTHTHPHTHTHRHTHTHMHTPASAEAAYCRQQSTHTLRPAVTPGPFLCSEVMSRLLSKWEERVKEGRKEGRGTKNIIILSVFIVGNKIHIFWQAHTQRNTQTRTHFLKNPTSDLNQNKPYTSKWTTHASQSAV